jgi:predicted CXXCH cytochrome family protein
MRDRFIEGRSKFGTNLSNHHPIGIDYDADLQSDNPGLTNPKLVDLPLRGNKLQCTSCHDPHSSDNPPFLHKSSLNGELCITCHDLGGSNWAWSSSDHAESDSEPRSGSPWNERKPEWRGRNVAENACENCHATHHASSAQRLVKDEEEATCFRCHNGSLAEFNIQTELSKFYRHPVDMPSDRGHEAASKETTFNMPFHVECEDCHNPHATRSDEPMISFVPADPSSQRHTQAPLVNGAMLGVTGLDISGQHKQEAEFEYEVCFKCHGVPGKSACDNERCSTAIENQMVRQDNVYNLREKFDSNNPSLVSFHPIDINNPANDSEVPSLRLEIPLNRTGSRIYCGDCHAGAFSPAAGGSGPGGPHGSRHAAILALGYELNPTRRYNPNSNGLCLKCHDTTSLFNDESFMHRKHVLEEGSPCATCHDPHGSAVYPHLINFLTSASGAGQNFEITGAGGYTEPTWIDGGRYSGTCWLSCHGSVHEGLSY